MRCLILLSAFAVSITAWAQPDSGIRIPEDEIKINLTFDYLTPASVEGDSLGDDIDLSNTRSKAQVTGFKFNRPTGTAFRGAVEYVESNYNFDGIDPFESVDIVGANISIIQGLSRKWDIMATIGQTFAAADTGSLGQGRSGFYVFGARHRFTPNLTVMFGVFYNDDLEEDDSIIPVASIDWKINERLRLRTFNGAFLTYDYKEDESIQLEVGIAYNAIDFNIGRTGAASLGLQGVGTDLDFFASDEAIIANGAVRFNLPGGTYLKGFVAGSFARDFTIRANELTIEEWDVGNAVRFGVQGGYTF